MNCIYLFSSWRQVEEDDDSEFHYLEQEIHTNSSVASYTIEHLQPYTVYSFQVCAVNHVGRSRSSKNSYPSITLRESKFIRFFFICDKTKVKNGWKQFSCRKVLVYIQETNGSVIDLFLCMYTPEKTCRIFVFKNSWIFAKFIGQLSHPLLVI